MIPGNDDAIRSIKLITQRVADAVIEGAQRRKEFQPRDGEGGGGGRGPQAEVSYGRRRPQSEAPEGAGAPVVADAPENKPS